MYELAYFVAGFMAMVGAAWIIFGGGGGGGNRD